jgi:2-phosphosulfolactate phosphatase
MTTSGKTVVIDCFPENVRKYSYGYGVVAVDVVHATTTAVSALTLGRKCYPVSTLEDAFSLAGRIQNPLLVGDLGGNKPFGFDLMNSPAEISHRSDYDRPMILLSNSGTQLMKQVSLCESGYIACFRNFTATAEFLMQTHEKVAIVGAGTRSEFREEDKLCCAWIAGILHRAGYDAANDETAAVIDQWSSAPPEACHGSKSLISLGMNEQLHDLAFLFTHIDDVDSAFRMEGEEIVRVPGVFALRAQTRSRNGLISGNVFKNIG